jgi:ADP-ribose pyrophosphatase
MTPAPTPQLPDDNDSAVVTLYAGQYVRFVRENNWEYADRVGVTGIVFIAAITDNDELLLVEQYRTPVGANVIELPAGLAGDVCGQEDEALIDAAKRELLEETGFESDQWRTVAHGPPSAGLASEILTLLVARNCKQVASGGGDETEDIIVHKVALDRLHDWLGEQVGRGAVIDMKIWAGLYWLEKGLEEKQP